MFIKHLVMQLKRVLFRMSVLGPVPPARGEKQGSSHARIHPGQATATQFSTLTLTSPFQLKHLTPTQTLT